MGNWINGFENLDAWKQAIEVGVKIYSVTKKFPKEELFAMTNQMRRAGYSVSANLAEGFGRHGKKEKLQFYKIANGSLLELKSFCYLANRIGYIDAKELQEIIGLITPNQKLINALIKSVRGEYE